MPAYILQPVRTLARALICLCAWFAISMTLAQEAPAPVVSITSLETMLAKVSADSALSDIQKTRNTELIELAKARLQSASVFQSNAQDYRQSISDSTAKQEKLRQEFAAFSIASIHTNLTDVALNELELQSTTINAELKTLQSRIEQIDSGIKAEKSLDISKAIEDTRALSDELAGIENDPLVQDSVFDVLSAATRNMQQAQINALQQRQLSRASRLSLWDTEKKLVLNRIEVVNQKVVQLRAAITNNRQSFARRTANEARVLQASLVDTQPEILAVALEVVEKSDELVALVIDHDRILRRIETADKDRQRVARRFTSLTEQLEASQLASSPEFGAALRRLRDQLASVDGNDKRLREIEQNLTNARLAQFQTDELKAVDETTLRRELVGASVNDINRAADNVTDHETFVVPAVDNMLVLRNSVLNELSDSYPEHIRILSQLASIKSGAIDDSIRFTNQLDQHLLWMPSAPPMNLDTLINFGSALAWILSPVNWQQVASSALQRLKKAPFPTLIGFLLVIILFWVRPRLHQNLREFANQTSSLAKGTYFVSVRALFATLALALPVPFIMLVTAGLIHQANSFSGGVAHALRVTAIVVFVLIFIYQTAHENGLARKHLNWSSRSIRSVRRNIPWFLMSFIPLVWLNVLIDAQGSGPVRDSLGRALYVAATIILAVFTARVFSYTSGVLANDSSDTRDEGIPLKVKFLYALMVTLPIVIAGFSVAGYHYTAIKLDTYMLQSVFAVIVGVYFYGFARRWCSIGERRLALQSDLAKQEFDRAQAVDHETDDNTLNTAALTAGWKDIDLKILRSQTNVLLKTIAVVVLGLALWNIWSDFAPAFKPLDNIRLWSADKVVDGVMTLSSVTLFDVLLALFVALISYLAAKNIPAVIEVALRNRRTIEAGTVYAITSVSRYLFIIVGTVITLQLLGAQWSKLQWLVAALSVGLGFGLQEIVANFVSGIVILFERPIRIGDTVTVGEQWGTVNKIRIRATTILDWDRRELIIPNKTFITERLVNWTLTDPITRTTIRVGVAYGSDVALVEKLLLDIAAREAKVLIEPSPSVLFKAFGESSLDFEIRVYVRGVHDLVPVAHAMHVAIDGEFRKHGIEISFPQRDLHFDGRPLEIKILDANWDANSNKHSPEQRQKPDAK